MEGFQASGSGAGRNSLVVLLVDDDPVNLMSLEIFMAMQGCRVLSASDGLEGLERSRGYVGRIDLVISDEEMPHLKGRELCARSC